MGVTGIVTFFNVTGNIDYPAIKENDLLGLEREVQVLDKRLSRIREIRAVDGTAEHAHTVTTKYTKFLRNLLQTLDFIPIISLEEISKYVSIHPKLLD